MRAILVGGTSGQLVIDLIVGFLIFSSTLFFASNAFLIPALVILLFYGPKLAWRSDYLLILIFVALAYLNILFHANNFDVSIHISSLAVPLVFLIVLLAPRIGDLSLKVFVVLTCLEILIGVYEFQSGQVALFASQVSAANQEMSYESSFLYDLRVYGLSSNSSILAEKIFLSVLIIYQLKNSFRNLWLWYLLLGIGLLITFNRTTIITIMIFLLSIFFAGRVEFRRIAAASIFIIGIVVLFYIYSDEVLLQFARGSIGELSYSEESRLYFWQRSFDHLIENPITGNGSLTYRIFSPEAGTFQHAHNSFVMIFATHGLFIPLFMVGFIILRFKFVDWRVALAFFIYSMTQYLIFWNLSVPDLIFYWVLGVGIYNKRLKASVCDQFRRIGSSAIKLQ